MRRFGYTPVCLVPFLVALIVAGQPNRGWAEEEGRRQHLLKIDSPDSGYLSYPVFIIGRNTAEAFTFNPAEGDTATISYKLTRPGRIRVRIVRRDNKEILIRTLQDWANQAFGRHALTWDGRDASGNIVDNRKCLVVFDRSDDVHRGHDADRCQDLILQAIHPTRGDTVGAPIEVQLDLVGVRAPEGDSGYRISLYADYRFQTRQSAQGDARRFALPWDPGDLADGPHMITVVVDDGVDHAGSVSIPVVVGTATVVEP